MLLASLFLTAALGAAIPAAPQCERSGARGADSEPNDSTDTASPIYGGDAVDGSLMLSDPADYNDYYQINDTFSVGKLFCATLYHLDYDSDVPWRIDFHISIGYMYYGYWYSLAATNAANRTETAVIMGGASYSSDKLWIRIFANGTGSPWAPTTEAGRYRLTFYAGDPPEFPGGAVMGFISNRTGPGSAFFKMNPAPADEQMVLLTLHCPSTGNYSLAVYNIWPITKKFTVQNTTSGSGPGGDRLARVLGIGGPYYIGITLGYYYTGFGEFQLSSSVDGGAMDGDNFPSKATPIFDSFAYGPQFVASGVDPVDWYVIEMKAGRPVPDSVFSLVPSEFSGYFNFSAFDKDLNYIVGSNSWESMGGSIDLKNISVPYNGPAYFAVCAGYTWGSYMWKGIGWYKVCFALPNEAPRLNGTLPEVRMLEDTTDDSLVLSGFITDPDNDTLTFTLLGSGYHSKPKVNATTGRVTFSPEADWSGTEKVRFEARDDGPGKKSVLANTTVVVGAENDPPRAVGAIPDIVILEETADQTPDLSACFRDVDDIHENLTYKLAVKGQDTHPPGAVLPIAYDSPSHTFRLGPARGMFGNISLQATCSDGHTGSPPTALGFNLTITHRNHPPELAAGITDPLRLTVREHESNSQLVAGDLFADPDIDPDYAGDALGIALSGTKKLSAAIDQRGRLAISTGEEQYFPGAYYEETLTLTATDKAGLKRTLNITVTVDAVDDPPYLTARYPADVELTVKEGGRENLRVSASDNDTRELAYSWFVDGTRDRVQASSSFVFQPDYAMGGAVHTVRAVVSDGTTNLSVEWSITVVDVNRPPSVTITSPQGFAKFKRGEFITFTADAKDEDGDDLTITWRDGAGTVLGTGASISTDKLGKGQQTVRVEVGDGKANLTADVVVMISAPGTPPAKGFIPGYSGAALAAAVAAVLAIAEKRRRRA